MKGVAAGTDGGGILVYDGPATLLPDAVTAMRGGVSQVRCLAAVE